MRTSYRVALLGGAALVIGGAYAWTYQPPDPATWNDACRAKGHDEGHPYGGSIRFCATFVVGKDGKPRVVLEPLDDGAARGVYVAGKERTSQGVDFEARYIDDPGQITRAQAHAYMDQGRHISESEFTRLSGVRMRPNCRAPRECVKDWFARLSF